MILAISCIIEEIEKHLQEAEADLKLKRIDSIIAKMIRRKIANLESAKIHLLRI